MYHFTPGEIKIFCKPVCQPGLKLLPTCGSGVTRVPVTCMNISRSYFFPACIFPQSLMQFLRFSSHGVCAQLRHPRKSRVSFAKPFIGGAVRNIKRVSKEREAYEIFHSFIVGVLVRRCKIRSSASSCRLCYRTAGTVPTFAVNSEITRE